MSKKEMRKVFALSLFAILILGIFSVMVSAATPINEEQLASQTAGAIKGIGGGLYGLLVTDILTPLFGEQELLTKVFFGVLLLLIINSIVDSLFFQGKKWYYSFFFSLIIVILAIIALPVNFIQAIRDQYGVMGAAILSIIPFAIMVVFTSKIENKLVAKLTWVFYLVYYFALFVYEVAVSQKPAFDPSNYPYFAAIVAGIAMLFLLDIFRKWWWTSEIQSQKESAERTVDILAANREAELAEAEQIRGFSLRGASKPKTK